MKKIISLILVFIISIAMFSIPTQAKNEFFIAVGNTILPLNNKTPIQSGGVWYIDYQCFTGGSLGISTSYNESTSTLVMYTWDTTLIFDLKKATAYRKENQVSYKAVAVETSGTVYVPVQFTAQIFGLDYTYFADLSLIRIKRSTDIPDDIFFYIAESEIPNVRAEYDKQTGSAKPQTGNHQNTPDANRKSIKLTFNITDGKNLGKIVDVLNRYGYKATFFIQGSAIEACKSELRYAVISGHALGSLSQNGASDFALSSGELEALLDTVNDNLFELCKTKTRLLRIPGGSKSVSKEKYNELAGFGYRIWDSTISPTGKSASSISSFVTSKLNSSSSAAVISLSDSDASVKALDKILSHIKAKAYYVSTIDILDNPDNFS